MKGRLLQQGQIFAFISFAQALSGDQRHLYWAFATIALLASLVVELDGAKRDGQVLRAWFR